MKEYQKQYYIDNKEKYRKYRESNEEKIKEYRKQYYKDNIKKLSKKAKQWQIDNPIRAKMNKKQCYLNNKNKALKQTLIWRDNNPEKVKEIYRKYRKNHKIKINIEKRKWMNFKRKTDLKYSLNHRISESIRQSLRKNKNGRHWEDLVGYTLNNLIKRLKKTMPEDYNWNDFLNGNLHIDHKIPISAFNFTKTEHTDFKRCWGLSNLQLLSAKENIIKYNKLSKPFQPSLKI